MVLLSASSKYLRIIRFINEIPRFFFISRNYSIHEIHHIFDFFQIIFRKIDDDRQCRTSKILVIIQSFTL